MKKIVTTFLLFIIAILLAIIAYLVFEQNNIASHNSNNGREERVITSTGTNISEAKLLDIENIKSTYNNHYKDSNITSIEVDRNLIRTYFEVTGVDDNNENTLKINAKNQKIISHHQESLDNDENNGRAKKQDSIDFNQIISLKKAVNKAKTEYKGTLQKWALEKDDGHAFYEIDLKKNGQTVSFKIDAEKGSIVEKDND